MAGKAGHRACQEILGGLYLSLIHIWVGILNQGRLIACDTPQNLKLQFARDEVQLLTKDRKVLRVKKNQEGAKAIYDAICGGDCLTIHSREPNLEEDVYKRQRLR